MAEATKTILIDIKVPYKEAVDGIVKLQDEIEKLTIERNKWASELKRNDIDDKAIKNAQQQVEMYNAEIRQLKKSQKEYRTEIDANLQAEEANAGSLKQMRAELKNLIKEYDALSQVDREEIGGVGENKLLEIRRLQEELRQAEEASGRFQRSVGSYEDAIRKALEGTIPMKTAMRELKTEIQTVEFQYRQMGDTIQQRTKELEELGRTVGTDTEDYKEQAAELENLKKQYDETGASLDKMKQSAGQMDDAMKDASQSIANFGKDNANLKAMTDGAQLLLDSYTVLKAGMAALGVESEELMNVFAKIQILQQGLNAVNKIANMLEEQSVLRQQARVLWTKLTTTSIASMTAAKKKDAAASVEAAAGDAALAAGETAATAAAGGLTAALKAVGAAIKSIPIIGWIAGAVAILGTLIGLIVKANKEEKEANSILSQRKQLQNELNEIEKQSLENVQKSVVAMETNVRHLKAAKEGTKEWDELVAQVATDLGVDVEWLKKNIDKVDELKQVWIQLQIAMAKAQTYAQKMADNEVKIATAETEIAKIMASNKFKDRAEAISKELGVSLKAAKALVDADHKLKKNNTSENYVKYANAMNAIKAELESQNKVFMDGLDKAYDEQVQNQQNLSDLAEGHITDTGNKANKETEKVAKKTLKTAKELSEELEDLMVEGMADGVEKEIAQIEKASKRWVESMKEAREKDIKNKDLYDALIAEKEKQTQEKVKKLRSEAYKQMLEQAKKISQTYNEIMADSRSNPLSALRDTVSKVIEDTKKKIEELNKAVADAKKSAIDNIVELLKRFKELLDKISDDDLANAIGNAFKLDKDLLLKNIGKIKQYLLSAFEEDGFTLSEFELIGKDEDGKIRRITGMTQELFKIILNELTKIDETYAELKDDYEEISKNSIKNEKTINTLSQNRIGFAQEELVIRRKLNAEYKKAAQENLDALLEQAQRGALTNIPESFTVYIDFQIENLEDKIAKEREKLLNYTNNGDAENIKKSQEAIAEMNEELARQYELRQNISRATELEMRELKTLQGEGLGFFDSQELKLNEIEIEKLQNQLNALYDIRQQGAQLESEVAVKEAELAAEREKYHSNLMIMTEEEKAKAEEQLASKEMEIESLNQEMAAIGYSGREAIDQMIDEANTKMYGLSKNTSKIWANNVKTVLSSFSQVTNAFTDLMNEIGEDNEELQGFLKALSLAQIMVNLAVSISEAVSSGAGQPFPYNLAAIAAGVAAVVAAITSAIQIFKKNSDTSSAPHFATGGYVSGEKGVDKIPAWLSDGEYVIKKKRVKELGVPFLDSLNEGHSVIGRRHFAEGGYVSQITSNASNSQMQFDTMREIMIEAVSQVQPVVSVREITNTQQRVKTKEIISKK